MIKVILTGATGSEVLRQCLSDRDIRKIAERDAEAKTS
jgi:hypothetical protein